MTIALPIRTTILWFAALTCTFVSIGIAMPLAAYFTGGDIADATYHVLNVRREGNIPSLLSGTLLATAALLLFLIARVERDRGGRDAGYWRLLAFIFVYLAVDEIAQIHEVLNQFPIGNSDEFAVFDRLPWMWFYMPLVLALALGFSRFLLRLPRDTAIIFVVSGACYVGGALGLEIVGAHQIVVEHIDRDSLQFVLRGVLKEFFMYSGITLFIWCLLHRLRDYGAPIGFRFIRPGRPA